MITSSCHPRVGGDPIDYLVSIGFPPTRPRVTNIANNVARYAGMTEKHHPQLAPVHEFFGTHRLTDGSVRGGGVPLTVGMTS